MNGVKIAATGIFSLLCWLVAGWFMLAVMMGDCFPGEGRSCPTDSERNMTVLGILIGAFALNAFVIFLIQRERSAKDED